MSNKINYLFAMLAVLFASCTTDVTETNEKEVLTEDGITFNVEPIKAVEDIASRSRLDLTNTGLQFSWEVNDKITIFAGESDNAYNVYTLYIPGEDKTHAKAEFNGGGFNLAAGKRYYSISTAEQTCPAGTKLPDKGNITLSFAGQKQIGNKNTDHLGKYDYMAATSVASSDNVARFDYKHLTPTLRIIMTDLPDYEFSKLEMYDSENSFLQPVRTIDLTQGLSADGNEYNPVFNTIDQTTAEYKTADRFSLDLYTDASTPGLMPTGTDKRLDMFMKIPPYNFSGKDIIFIVYPKDNTKSAYYITSSGRNLVGGTAYQMKAKANEATTYNVKIKVNQNWINGNTVSRGGTGDPGYDDTFDKPTNLYYILCVNGFAYAGQSQNEFFKEIEGISSAKWTDPIDGIITYADQLTFNITDKTATKHLYVVASCDDLTSVFGTITSTTKEEDIQKIMYTITPDQDHDNEYFMKHLYSTPYKEGVAFVGDLKDYYQDVVLYHVGAKVDLKWNSAEKLTGSVSISNVQKDKLNLFKPTENTVSTSNKFNVSATITPKTMYNGRQVFYLPQFAPCQYDVTIGTKNYSGFEFTPYTGNAFTSWLRGLIEIPKSNQ